MSEHSWGLSLHGGDHAHTKPIRGVGVEPPIIDSRASPCTDGVRISQEQLGATQCHRKEDNTTLTDETTLEVSV